jgi:hypothetical protein
MSELVGDPLAALDKGSNPCASSRAIDLADRWWVVQGEVGGGGYFFCFVTITLVVVVVVGDYRICCG